MIDVRSIPVYHIMNNSTSSAFQKQLKLALKWYQDPVRLARVFAAGIGILSGSVLTSHADPAARGTHAAESATNGC